MVSQLPLPCFYSGHVRWQLPEMSKEGFKIFLILKYFVLFNLEINNKININIKGRLVCEESVPRIKDLHLTIIEDGFQVLYEAGSGAVDTPFHHLDWEVGVRRQQGVGKVLFHHSQHHQGLKSHPPPLRILVG